MPPPARNNSPNHRGYETLRSLIPDASLRDILLEEYLLLLPHQKQQLGDAPLKDISKACAVPLHQLYGKIEQLQQSSKDLRLSPSEIKQHTQGKDAAEHDPQLWSVIHHLDEITAQLTESHVCFVGQQADFNAACSTYNPGRCFSPEEVGWKISELAGSSAIWKQHMRWVVWMPPDKRSCSAALFLRQEGLKAFSLKTNPISPHPHL